MPQKGFSSLICSVELSFGSMLTNLKKLKETAEEADYKEESDDSMALDDTSLFSYHTAKRLQIGL